MKEDLVKEKISHKTATAQGGEATPFFSIIVPCCDVAQYLHKCLDSVLGQPFKDWECLLGVETSKDNTEEIARQYAAKDPRFKVFTGPRSGSCSAPRNTGIDMAQGEYIIFLDGDDTIVEGSLLRLHDKIAARPGADLYPCAVQVLDAKTGKVTEVRDNYPVNAQPEFTGPEATLFIAGIRKHPFPMMQLTICRRAFLVENKLKCIHGLRGQDRNFSPRALYFAKRVCPLHEPFYIYLNNRTGSVVTSIDKGILLKDEAIIHQSLFEFHSLVSSDPGFDRRLTARWGQSWISWIAYTWFSPMRIKRIPRARRVETLAILFKNGYGDFGPLLGGVSTSLRLAGKAMYLFAGHPLLRIPVEMFFRLYFLLSKIKSPAS